jgi:hypothetical protein
MLGLGLLSGCKPFQDGTGTGSCIAANYAAGTPIPIAPSQSNGSSIWTDLAQSFVTYGAASISQAGLELTEVLASGVTSLAGQTVTLGLYPDNVTSFSGAVTPTSPSTTPLAIASIDMGTIQTFAQFYEFTFDTSVALTANTPYWLVLSTSLSQGSTSYVAWMANTDNSFTTGFALFDSSNTGAFAPLSVYGATGANIDFLFQAGC